MRAAFLRLSSYCCRTQVHWPCRQLSSLPAPLGRSGRLLATEPDKELSNSCLYILDLLPLVYKYLPRDQPPAAPQQAAVEHSNVQQLDMAPAESFLGALLSLMKRPDATPTHLAIAVDVPGATYRHRMYPQYKAQRREHPPALTDALCRILAVVDALGIPVLSVPGVEADDVVGTLAARAQRDGFGAVVIMSPDKDYYQLLSPTVSILNGGELYTLERFTEEQQLQDPRLWIDIKALMGDHADNIPGLKGIGGKTAKKLVQSLGSVENITQQLAALTQEEGQQIVKLSKQQRALLLSEDGKVAAGFMKELVTINTKLKAPPCQQPWHVFELKLPADGGQRALEWSQKLGMDWLHFRLQDHFKRLQLPA